MVNNLLEHGVSYQELEEVKQAFVGHVGGAASPSDALCSRIPAAPPLELWPSPPSPSESPSPSPPPLQNPTRRHQKLLNLHYRQMQMKLTWECGHNVYIQLETES